MRAAFIGLGSNIGDREKNIRRALYEISALPETELIKISSFYETSPWGKVNQPSFINATAKIKTNLSPQKLLESCLAAENNLGRVRCEHWGSRTIDIDILFMEGVTTDSGEIRLPHPYMLKRKFVLQPLAEIAPSLNINGMTVAAHLIRCPDSGAVTRTPGCPRDFSLKMIACVSKNFGIGRAGQLLFRLAADMDSFREHTVGASVIMGRKTADSLPNGRALRGRNNIVLSRQIEKKDGFTVCRSLEDLWDTLTTHYAKKIFVIGGGETYRLLMPYSDEALITYIDETKEADTFFPDPAEYDFSLKETHIDTDETGTEIEFRRYLKR